MKVYLVEDSAEIRQRLHDMVLACNPAATVFEAVAQDEAIAGILQTQPQLVLLDLKLEAGSGLDVLRTVKTREPANQVVVFSNHATPPYRKRCMELGATGFFDKAHEFELMRDRVRQLLGTLRVAKGGEKNDE